MKSGEQHGPVLLVPEDESFCHNTIDGCERETEECTWRSVDSSHVCWSFLPWAFPSRGDPPMFLHGMPQFCFPFQLGVWTIPCSVRVLKLDLSVGCQQMDPLRGAQKSFIAILSEVES